jgi:hypothetical protein
LRERRGNQRQEDDEKAFHVSRSSRTRRRSRATAGVRAREP